MRRGRCARGLVGIAGMAAVVGAGCGRSRPTYEYEPNVTTVYTAQPVPPVPAGPGAPPPSFGGPPAAMPAGMPTAGMPASGPPAAPVFPATTPSTIPQAQPQPPRRPTSWVGPGARE